MRWLTFALLGLAGCPAHHATPDGGGDAVVEVDCGAVVGRDVSVLFVVQSQSEVFPAVRGGLIYVEPFVSALRERIEGDLRIAVLNGNVGPGDVLATGCRAAGHGGVFHTTVRPDGRVLGPILRVAAGDDAAAAISDAQDLLYSYESDQCVNQVLEAGLRALAPASLDLEVPHGVVHGDMENAGFVQRGGVLMIVFVTHLDDCSWNDTVVPGSPVNCPEGEYTCCDEVLFPVQRYIDGYGQVADALDVELVVGVMSAAALPDVPLSEWRRTGGPLCIGEHLREVPIRLLEFSEAFAPYATSQPWCASGPPPNLSTIVDRVVAAACR